MKDRAVKTCLAQFTALQARNDLEPEQRQAIEAALSRIKQHARKQNPSRAETFRCIREVSEKLFKAFLRR